MARTQSESSKIAAFEIKCLREILDIIKRKKYQRANINQRLSKDRPDIIKTRQAIWFGHVTRMEETRLPRIALNEKIPLKNKNKG